MSDRKFLPLSLKTATLTFKKLNLGNESILKGCRRIPAGLFEEYHFAFRGLKLMVPVPKIEVGGLDLPEGDKSFFPVEGCSLVSYCSSRSHPCHAGGGVDGNV